MSERKKLDPAKTREEVLAAAIRLFSEKGFDGTSIAEIAVEAKVTKSLVLYHFGTKDELWQKALQERTWPVVDTLLRYGMGDTSLTLLDILKLRFELMLANPEIPRMIRWTTLGQAPMPKAFQEIVPLVVRRAMVELGEMGLPKDISPHMLVVAVMGASDSWFVYRRLYSSVSGIDFDGPEADEQFFRTLVALLPPRMRGECDD